LNRIVTLVASVAPRGVVLAAMNRYNAGRDV
jgi:hypothetical protein